MRLQQMQDIAGLRAISASVVKYEKLRRAYADGYLQHECVAGDDYISRPKSDGYRSNHLIYRYRNRVSPEYDGLHVELQLRTRLQHSWATAVETVDAFMGQSIKAGRATPQWASFFKSASALFAKIEGLGDVPGYERLTQLEVIDELRYAESRLNVLNRLRGFRVAADEIMKRDGGCNRFLHLVVLNHETMRLSFNSYGEGEQEKASFDYMKAEESVRNGVRIDPVLVAGGSLVQLKKSYPNYFADNHIFIGKVALAIDPSKRVFY